MEDLPAIRCDITELPVEMCAHCRGKMTTPEEETNELPRWLK